MILEFIFRWFHVIFGITWIGMLYYFNFVQTEYFKEAEAEGLKDAKAKLAPRALWWFRWGAMFTFLTGLVLLWSVGALGSLKTMPVIWLGSIAGILMFLNVWLILWPNQTIVLGLSGQNGMLGSKHLYIADVSMVGVGASLALIRAAEANALFGKTGPMTSVVGVIHCSIAMVAIIWALLAFL